MKTHAFRLLPGDDLKAGINKFIAEKHISAAVVLACVGSLSKASLRLANASEPILMEEKFEIVAMEATLSIAGSHIHIALADKNGNLKAGHLAEPSTVFTTAELVIAELDSLIFTREPDAATGYKELVVKNQQQ